MCIAQPVFAPGGDECETMMVSALAANERRFRWFLYAGPLPIVILCLFANDHTEDYASTRLHDSNFQVWHPPEASQLQLEGRKVRRSLDKNCGMMLFFSEEDVHTVWKARYDTRDASIWVMATMATRGRCQFFFFTHGSLVDRWWMGTRSFPGHANTCA